MRERWGSDDGVRAGLRVAIKRHSYRVQIRAQAAPHTSTLYCVDRDNWNGLIRSLAAQVIRAGNTVLLSIRLARLLREQPGWTITGRFIALAMHQWGSFKMQSQRGRKTKQDKRLPRNKVLL